MFNNFGTDSLFCAIFVRVFDDVQLDFRRNLLGYEALGMRLLNPSLRGQDKTVQVSIPFNCLEFEVKDLGMQINFCSRLLPVIIY